MKAFVMAAGAGTRLRPLTYGIPKPMVPVANKPVLEHVLENLKKHGISEVVLNLYHFPQVIRKYFGDGSSLGIKIIYSKERKLLGTAGGVKKMEKVFDSTFLVMSGDGLTDINLSKVLEFHRKKKALGTMVLKEIDSKFDYGVTLVDSRGKIKKFIEKPSWSDVFANTVNTGIYIFEPEIFKFIPKNKFYDFGTQLWPELLKKKKRIFAFATKDYWTDVGNIREYRKGVCDALEGNIRLNIPGKEIRPGIRVGEGTKIEKGAKLIGPCVIGRNCFIGRNACLGKLTAVGDYSKIESGAVIKNSILWSKVKVAKNVRLENCVIGYRAKVSEDISVFEGTVLNID